MADNNRVNKSAAISVNPANLVSSYSCLPLKPQTNRPTQPIIGTPYCWHCRNCRNSCFQCWWNSPDTCSELLSFREQTLPHNPDVDLLNQGWRESSGNGFD